MIAPQFGANNRGALVNMTPLRIDLNVLGPFLLLRDGEPVTVAAKKNRALLAVLALSPRFTATRERLAGLLWGDRQEEQARSSLRQSLALLRKDLGEAGEAVLLARDDAIALLPAALTVDAIEFQRLGLSEDILQLRQAASLYRDECFADYSGTGEGFGSWLSFERARLKQEAVRFFDRLAQRESGQAALSTAQRLVALDPLREASHRRVMEAQFALGDRALALRQFEELRTLLKGELDVEPAAETRALASKIAEAESVPGPAISSRMPDQTPALRPTLAVLPFKNLSGDASQDFFSDGITDDLITELSRFRNLQVFARRSSFGFRDAESRRNVGQELGATYILEGSVRKHGTRVRVTVQLSQAQSGEQIWAERFDRDLTDILALQEDVARNIAGTLAIELDDRELDIAHSKPLEDFRAYEHWLNGKRILWTEGASNLEARRHFLRAADIDPGFARAHAGLGVTYVEEAVQFPPEEEFHAALAKAHESSLQAVLLDPSECLGHAALGWSYLYLRDYDQARKHVDTALRLNPNDADMLANAAYVLAMYGDSDRAVLCGKTAMRLNPRHPDWYLGFAGTALFAARRYEEAIEVRSRSPGTFYDSWFFGASMLARLGRIGEARQWVETGMRKLEARVGRERMEREGCIRLLTENNPFRTAEDIEHFAESMRLAGVPG